MTSTPAVIATSHPNDSLLRADRFPHILCPACGIGTVIHCYVDAMAESGVDLDRHACVSGIGCSGRAAGYVNVDSYHTTHGRAIPFALGIALHKPELRVTVISGDGDLAAIGGNHLIHAARRNMDITVICINNFNYGMTGGQAGPTSPRGSITSTAPLGVNDRPFNLPDLARAAGASFVARWTVLHARQLREAILLGLNKRGFSFIEALSPCPTNFGRSNDLADGMQEMELYRQRCRIEHGTPAFDDLSIDILDEQSPIVVGNFVDIERAPFLPVGKTQA
jgi:2-oxoglutarate ferredoxin oxidoreductase subunit beta